LSLAHRSNAQKQSEKKEKDAAKSAPAGPKAKELTHAQIKERDATAMRLKQEAKAKAAGGK